MFRNCGPPWLVGDSGKQKLQFVSQSLTSVAMIAKCQEVSFFKHLLSTLLVLDNLWYWLLFNMFKRFGFSCWSRFLKCILETCVLFINMYFSRIGSNLHTFTERSCYTTGSTWNYGLFTFVKTSCPCCLSSHLYQSLYITLTKLSVGKPNEEFSSRKFRWMGFCRKTLAAWILCSNKDAKSCNWFIIQRTWKFQLVRSCILKAAYK